MNYSKILRKLTLCLLALVSASSLSAQQRDWTASDGATKFKAELVNAYGDTAFFHKADDGYIHMPIALLSRPDVARILEWARERDAKKATVLMNCDGQTAKDICKQWPNKVSGETLKDADVNNIDEPNLFAFLMIKKETVEFEDQAIGLANAEKAINGDDGHFLQLVSICPLKDNELKPIIFMLGKKGGNWLMPNEWSYKDKKEIWTNYWRKPDLNVLVIDPQGHVLCDGSGKEPDGSPSDPIAFLNKMAPIAESLRNGGDSVTNPYINEQAITDTLAKALAAKTSNPRPQPVIFDFSGIDSEINKTMEGLDYVISIDIGTDGKARNLILKKGGDMMTEKALRQAAALWQFIPVLKDGVPEAKTVVIPIHVKTTAPAAK